MRFFARWLRIVGAVNIGLGAIWLPFLDAARLGASHPAWRVPVDGTAYESLVGHLMMFGLDLIALGVILLFASSRPAESLVVAWLAIALSIVRGVVNGIHLIMMGYSLPAMLALIALHLVIIATGLLALRTASRRMPVGCRIPSLDSAPPRRAPSPHPPTL